MPPACRLHDVGEPFVGDTSFSQQNPQRKAADITVWLHLGHTRTSGSGPSARAPTSAAHAICSSTSDDGGIAPAGTVVI